MATRSDISPSGVARRGEHLPSGVGRFTLGWFLLAGVLLAVIAFGIRAYALQETEGDLVTGMRDIGPMGGAAWGLYVAFIIYFVGVSFAGISVAALIRLLNLEQLRPLSRMAELLTIVSLLLAAMSVLADQGQPLRALINFPRYARPQSPMFGTFTLVISGYLFASLVYFYLAGRRDAALMAQRTTTLRWFYRLWAAGYRDTPAEQERHHRTSFWLAIAILPLLVIAHSTLGLIFGLQVGRAGWYSALQAPAFVILAGLSGIGFLIIVAAIMKGVLKDTRLSMAAFKWLGLAMLVLLLVYAYFTAVEMLTGLYAGHHEEQRVTQALLWGDYAGIFWVSIGSLSLAALLLLAQAFSRRWSISLLVLSGILVNVTAIGKRYLIVVPSQTHGMLLPYGTGQYSPTWVEYGVVLGLFAFGGLVYVVFMKVFPIMEVQAAKPARLTETTGPREQGIVSWRRRFGTTVMVVAGLGLMVISYLFFAAPWGFPPSSPAYSSPRVVLAPAPVFMDVSSRSSLPVVAQVFGSPPMLFILGVMLVFLAAVFYELVPEQRKGEKPSA